MINKFVEELRDWVTGLLGAVPGRSGRLLRRIYYRCALAAGGARLSIGRNVEISCPRNIRLGEETIVVSLPQELQPAPNDTVWLGFDQERLHLFDAQTGLALQAG